MTLREIERVLYYESFVVVEAGITDLEKGQLLTEDEYYEALDEYDDDFTAMMGAEAVQILLSEVDLEKEIQIIKEELNCLLYTSPSPRDLSTSRMPSSA